MKKIITISMAIVFVFAFGLAYAGESMPLDNGITMFSTGYVTTGANFHRVDAASYAPLSPREPVSGIEALAPDNGITVFAAGSVCSEDICKGEALEGWSSEGSAAGGYAEGSGMELGNGVTAFSNGPIDAN
jgi:hypothetical protein